MTTLLSANAFAPLSNKRLIGKCAARPENGQVAIEKVKDLNPDLVVLDMSMPVMDGFDAARQVNKTSPGLLLLMFTLYVSDQLSKEAKAVGIKDVLSKRGRVGRSTGFHEGYARARMNE